MSAESLHDAERQSLSSATSSRYTTTTLSSAVHMGWLQQRVPGLLFSAVWQPRFCVVKQQGPGAPQLHVYKTEGTVNGTLVSSLSLDRVHCHTYHGPSKLPYVLEIQSHTRKASSLATSTALFAIQSARLFQSWRAYFMALPGIQVSGTSSGSISRGVPAGMSPQPSHQQTPAASSTAARASITHALMDARACHKCLDTFLTASAVHSIDIDGTEVQRHLQLLLHTKWQSDELANDGVNMTWRVNETQVDHVPHRAVLVEASPFGWTWTVVDVFSTNSTTTSFRWRAEGYFTGRFDGQLGDGQVLEQDGFGQYNSQESRMDLYYNPCKLLSRLEEYAASAKRRLGTFAA